MASGKRRAVGDFLRTARQSIRFTQTDFADELGVSRRTLSRWENDHAPPDYPEWIVKAVTKFDRAIGERLAADLGVATVPVTFGPLIDQPIAAAAAALGIPHAKLRAELARIVASWQGTQATLEEIATMLKG